MPRSEKLAGKLVYNVARGKGFNFIYYPVDYKKTSLYLENLKGNTFEDNESYVFDLRNLNSLLFNCYHQYQYNSLTIILLSVKIHKFLYFEQQVRL